MRLKPHRLLSILPALTRVELEQATERVRLYGQRETVEVLDGELVGGHTEYLACLKAGVTPRVTRVKEPACLVEYVLRRNIPRHLSTLDRACIAVLAKEQYKKLGRERMKEAGRVGGKRKGRVEVTRPFGHERWFETAARVVGTTAGAVKRLAHLRIHAPDVFQAVRERKLVKLQDARDLAHALKAPEARAKVLELRELHPRLPVGRLVADVMRLERPPIVGAGVSRRAAHGWVVYEGPMAVEGKRVADGSVDLVVADIVYGAVEMAEEVARLSRRVLLEGGVLALIAGHNVLDVQNAVAKHLAPVAIGSYFVKNTAKRKWSGPVERVDCLPVLFFARGRARPIAHLAFVSETKEAEWRGWQKNTEATLDLIKSCVSSGARVLDPCCGAGTSGVAALRHGCEFIGIDVDPAAVKTSRARLADTEKDGNVIPMRKGIRVA